MNKLESKRNFKILYRINYLMLIFFILSSVSMVYANIIDFLKYGYSWEVITIINEIQVVETQFLFSNILFSFILVLGLIGCMFNITGWYQLKRYEIRIERSEKNEE